MSVTLVNSTNAYDWRDRPETDFYPTPAEVTKALLEFLKIPIPAKIWEPACGEKDMQAVLEQQGHLVYGTDIKNGIDFVSVTDNPGAEWVITNPPFIIAEQFIRKAFELNVNKIALLLKSQFWHSSNRRTLFEQFKPRYVLPLTWRPDFHFKKKKETNKPNAPTMEVAWTVWMPQTLYTEYIPLRKPK